MFQLKYTIKCDVKGIGFCSLCFRLYLQYLFHDIKVLGSKPSNPFFFLNPRRKHMINIIK